MGLITQTAKQYYTVTEKFTGTGSLSTFTLTFNPLPTAKSKFIVFIDAQEIDDDNYNYDNTTGIIYFAPSTPPNNNSCLLYTSPSPRDRTRSRMPSSA